MQLTKQITVRYELELHKYITNQFSTKISNQLLYQVYDQMDQFHGLHNNLKFRLLNIIPTILIKNEIETTEKF